MFAGFCIVQHEAAAVMLPLCVLETRREEGLSHERTGNHCWCCGTADQRCSDHYLHDAGAEAAERHCCTDWCNDSFYDKNRGRTKEARLKKITFICSVVFFVLILFMDIVMPLLTK